MRRISSWYRVGLCLVLALPCWAGDDNQKEYQRQQDKLKLTSNPVGKVKVLIKMSRIDLNGAASQAKNGDLQSADAFLTRYSEVVLQAQEILKNSGRNAQKNPAGYRELEISLSDQLRKLNDLKDSYPYDQQEKLTKAIQAAKTVQEEMLLAIFGPENLRQSHKDNKNKSKKAP